MKIQKVAVIGGGLAGLAAALEVEKQGHECQIFEATDRLGGKLKTDLTDGFRLDRGFQVLLPAYPEIRALNVMRELDFRPFAQGAILETERGQRTVSHPFQSLFLAVKSLFEDVISKGDIIALGKLARIFTAVKNPDELLMNAGLVDQKTETFLGAIGFSDRFINEFWVPFFSGIYLESKPLKTSAALFVYLVRMFAKLPVGVPALGIEQLPNLLNQRLKRTKVHLQSTVNVIGTDTIRFGQDEVQFDRVVDTTTRHKTAPFGEVTTLWFAGDKSKQKKILEYGNWLVLVTRPDMPMINHFAVMSEVSENYAPKDQLLLCVNVLKVASDIMIQEVQKDLKKLLGRESEDLRLLRSDRIERAFSLYFKGLNDPLFAPTQQSALAFGRALANKI